MPREQSGICSEPNLHGLVLQFNALDGHAASLRRHFGAVGQIVAKLADQFSEANLNAVLGIGATFWDTIYPESRPAGFVSLASVLVGDLEMPANPVDFLLYVRADRYDVLHLASQQLLGVIAPHADLIEQTHVFRFMDGRALTGFMLEPPYVSGRKKRELALIGDPESCFAQGAYMHVQRYRLDFVRWQALTQSQQEHVIGRTKLVGQLLADIDEVENTHAQRCTLQHAHNFLPLVFQDMPFGQLRAQGLVTVAFSCQPTAYEEWLRQRLGDGVRSYDLILDYMQVDSGAAFFAPSISFLEDMA